MSALTDCSEEEAMFDMVFIEILSRSSRIIWIFEIKYLLNSVAKSFRDE